MIPLTFGLNARGVVVANDLNPYREADQRQPAFICTTVVDSSNKVMAVSVGASSAGLDLSDSESSVDFSGSVSEQDRDDMLISEVLGTSEDVLDFSVASEEETLGSSAEEDLSDCDESQDLSTNETNLDLDTHEITEESDCDHEL